MSMNPPAPAPTRTETAVRTAQRTMQNYSTVILFMLGIVVGFVLARV